MSDFDPLNLPPLGAQVTVLENGLVLIIREDRSAPVVSAQVWCRAGSIDEGRWMGAGLSHVLEHMLFKGTTTRGPGRIDQEVQDVGGYMNAYTSFDRTVYWINVPSTGARVAVDILCDIVQHATLPEEELVKELDVIRREMDMCHDDPGRRSSRLLFETAYTRSPYRYPVIGLRDIFDAITREDVLSYYREKYPPNNLFLLVVGDLDPAAVEAQVREAFGGTKARPLPAVPWVEEPRQTVPREAVEEAGFELGHVHFSWHVPDIRHPDAPAVDVLSIVLGSGRSSRLHREVREKAGVVHSVEAWTYSPGGTGMFGVSAVVDGDKYLAAREAIAREIDRLQSDPPTSAELSKAVKQVTAGTMASRKTMQSQAQDLGSSWMQVRELDLSARYLEAVRKVTCEDLVRVARIYLTPENRTVCALLPKGSRPVTRGGEARTEGTPVTKITLSNGLRLLVKEDRRLPFVEFRAVFLGGVLAENVENSGVTGLMTRLLLKGTERRTAEAIAIEAESVGGSIDTYAGNNSFGVTVEVLQSDFGTGLDLLADVIRRPIFPADELEREREVQLAGIRDQKDHLLQSAGRMMRRGMFGDRGYGLDAIGTEESVAALTVESVRDFHRRLAVPNNCVLAVFGNVDTATVQAEAERVFGGWLPSDTGRVPLPETAPLTEVLRREETRDKKQAVVVLGFRGAELTDPERYALELVQEACSDLGSRLFMRIRDELGLAYYVGAQNFVGLIPGCFSFYAGTAPGKSDQVVTEFLNEIGKLRETGLTPEELKRSKAKIVGQRKISRQDLGSHAMGCALDELYGLGFAYGDQEDARIEAVTLEATRDAAKRFLTPDRHVLVVVKPGTE
jgi:zinc protease